MEQQLAQERQQIEEQKNLADQEKQKLLEELENRKQQREEERAAEAAMLQKLKQMEDKMLVGSQVMEKAMQQEQELRKAEYEVEERKRAEQRMKEELERQVEDKLNLEEKYSSKEEQLQKMTQKLEKLWHRHKNTQQDIQDLQKEFQTEREDMLETIRDLRKEVKLVCLTIENFIPMEQYQQIVERAHFDEASQEWVINNIELAGNRVRPKNNRRVLDGDGASPRTLLRGHGPDQGDDVAMMPERPNVYFVYTEDGGMERAAARPAPSPVKTKNQRMKSACRPGTANRKGRAVKTGALNTTAAPKNTVLHSPDPEPDEYGPGQYPKARGLVRAA